MRVIWTLDEWAEAIVDLPTPDDPPERVVFVPNERVAHQLRRALLERGAPSALIGTRFLTAVQFAREVVLEAGEIPLVNDHEIGPALLQRIFDEVPFRKLKREDLLSLPGWDAAFVRTLADLDAALLTPEESCAHPEPAVADLGRVHAALRGCGDWGSLGLLWQRAAELLDPAAVRGSVLAVVTGFESAAEAQLLRKLPRVTWLAWGVRPLRSQHLERSARLWGNACAEALRSAPSASDPSSSLSVLHASLFGDRGPHAAPDDDRVRGAIYAGVHDEVEAAVGWVVEQLLEHGTPAREVAILSATAEPYGALLRARLATLPWGDGPSPTWSERGVPLAERGDGPRLALLLCALREGLAREALAPLLPIIATSTQEHRVRGLGRAWETLNFVAAVGGGRGHLEGGSIWPSAWRSALARLELAQANAQSEPHERERQAEAARKLAELLPAIDALTALLARVSAGAPLRELWQLMAAFARAHLRLPPAGSAVARDPGRRGRALHAARSDRARRRSRAGLARRHVAAFGGAGRALRRAGDLSRHDPRRARSVVRSRAHRRFGRGLGAVGGARRSRTARRGARAAVAAVGDVARARASAAGRVLLGCARGARAAGVERATCEHRRQRASTGGRAARRDARAAGLAAHRASRAAAGSGGEQRPRARAQCAPAPCAVCEHAARAHRARRPDTRARRTKPGAVARRVARAARTRAAVGARRFARGCSAAGGAGRAHGRTTDLGDAPKYALVVSASIFSRAGAAVSRSPPGRFRAINSKLASSALGCTRSPRSFGGSTARRSARVRVSWPSIASGCGTLAAVRRSELRHGYPFANEQVAAAQQRALCNQLDTLITLDWNDGLAREFIAVERSFGFEAPFHLDTAAGPLHVRGKIDKLDRNGSSMLVRDIKTGGAKPRRPGDAPECGIDLQLGLYARVATQMAKTWGTPKRVGVEYIYLRSGEPLRSWLGADFAQLDEAVEEWLATAL